MEINDHFDDDDDVAAAAGGSNERAWGIFPRKQRMVEGGRLKTDSET